MRIFFWIKQNYFLAAILLVATALRFYNIDYQSVWLDEIHSLNEANPAFSLTQIYEALLVSEPHPPLYFLVVHYVFLIFGYTTFVLRVLSACVGILGVFSIYLLGKEIFNKKVGLYAALLLSVNYFHLYYSQEGRMYGLLFMATTLSFYFLIKLVKNANIKSALLYAFFAAAMIYCHFFALFALISQYVILLFFIVKPYQSTSRKFFKYCAISGFVTLLLYIPAFSLLKKSSEMTSFWIPKPTLDVYTQIIKDFFGQSEIVLFIISALLILFFIQLFKEESQADHCVDPGKDRLIFSFVVLSIWISVTLILPLVRSYLNVPMLVNRYFINILPAVLLIIAIGLYYIKNRLVLQLVLSGIVVFSLTDIVIVKNYYNNLTKTQFREMSHYIVENNQQHEPVVSSLAWYFPYFINNDQVKTTLVNSALDEYVNQMMQDSTKRKPFWYVDGHSRPYKVTEATQNYLDANFIVENAAEMTDIWTKHYVRIPNNTIADFDLSSYGPLQEQNGAEIKFNVENFETNNETVTANGWAYLVDSDSQGSKMEILVVDENKAKTIFYQKVKRNDVTEYFKSTSDLSNSGFSFRLPLAKLPSGKYQVAIRITNKKANKQGLVMTDKVFSKQ